ncbi:Ran1 protein, partial [Punctularia strigosozonata HHB-11173 SS5]|uniref:Ran1 protein n=1 Tax=Punctularia strigosozonata (strain HHB-11173) TaxID=741275 RepID=UPI0004417549
MEIKTQSMASDHANVVELHQVVEDEKSVYLIMQYCSGRTLCEAVASAPFGDNYLMDLRTRDVAAATRFIKDTFIQVLDAVARCHSVGVFHRDIKLENILLDEARQTAYLADFGLATTDALSREFRTGTSWYKSPEQQGSETKSSAYSSRHCDIWAMGVLLSCMVAGRPPWQHAETYDHDFASYL